MKIILQKQEILEKFGLESIDQMQVSKYATMWKSGTTHGWITEIDGVNYGNSTDNSKYKPHQQLSDGDLTQVLLINIKDFITQKFPHLIR